MLELLALRLQTKELVLELADVLGVVVISTVICYVNGACRVLKILQVNIEQTSWPMTRRLSPKTGVDSFSEWEKRFVQIDQGL